MISTPTKETTLPHWSEDLPENFDAEEFKAKLANMSQTIAGMIGDDRNDLLFDFFPKVLDALVTHESFNKWDNETRLRIIDYWHNLKFIVQELCKVFTPELNDSINGIESFISLLIIPNYKNK